MKCPACGTESSGKFCAECGAPVTDALCGRCAAPLVPGARFCTQCGNAARSAIGGNTGWYVAAGVLVVMIGLVAILVSSDGGNAGSSGLAGSDGAAAATGTGPMGNATGAPFAGGAPSGAGAGTPPPLTGTPREQADQLFNRIMSEREGGDTAQARFFLPMGIQAYMQAGELEGDGLYHLTLLHASAGQNDEAIATAEQILAKNPKHLLALGAAAEASEAKQDGEAAAKYYSRFLEAYPTEKTKTDAEYLDHSKVLPLYEQAARRFLKK